MEPWCQIELFGRLQVRQGHRIITRFRTRQTGALLAYFALHRDRPHPREVLIELLWPEDDLDAARHKLRLALSSLRHQLEPPGVPTGAVIVADRASAGLNSAAVGTDVAGFEAASRAAADAGSEIERGRLLTAAIELYRGELLPGYYDDWILGERDRLAETYLRTLEQWVCHLEREGDLRRALDYAGRLVAADPLRESSHRAMIQVLAACGEPASALRQYYEMERILREELDATPSAASRDLAHSIRSRAVEPASPAPNPTPIPLPAPGEGVPAETQGWLHGTRPQRPLPPATAAPALAGYLPPALNHFFGREEEMARLLDLLRSCPLFDASAAVRLVTLTGPGGSGKTRLALEVARRIAQWFDGAAWFIPLADLADPRHIGTAIRDILGLPHSAGQEPLEQVAQALSRQPALLVLDNFEQLLDATASVPSGTRGAAGALAVAALLESVPTLTCLITSRQRLDLTGEQEVPVLPLATPSSAGERQKGRRGEGEKGSPARARPVVVGSPLLPFSPSPLLSQDARTPERLMEFASVQLFVDRAQAARPQFQITEQNAAAVAELCDRLEGIPLAIELAAARVSVLTPAQMLSQLARRFDFLVSRRRNAAERHRTLRAAIDWSYRLLAPELRPVFAQLAIFRGGFTLEAAAAVCSGVRVFRCSGVQEKATDETEGSDARTPEHLNTRTPEHPNTHGVLDLLQALRDSSLILAEEEGDETRYRMLETLREYTLERLADEGGAAAAYRRHFAHFARLAEETEPRLPGADGPAWLARLEREHDNVRAALEWALDGDRAAGMELATGMGRFWEMGGHWSEGREWLDRYLALGEAMRPAERAEALYAAGRLAWHQGHFEHAEPYLKESLQLRRQIDDTVGVSRMLFQSGRVAAFQGELARARVLFEESLAIRIARNDQRTAAVVLGNLGLVALHKADYPQASACAERYLAISLECGDRQQTAGARLFLGHVAFSQEEWERAAYHYQASLTLRREIGDHGNVIQALLHLGHTTSRTDENSRARVYYEDALALCRTCGERLRLVAVLLAMAHAALRDQDTSGARGWCEESLAVSRELGDQSNAALSLACLGRVALREGTPDRARTSFEESLAIYRGYSDASAAAYVLEDLAEAARATGEHHRARVLLEESLALRQTLGAPPALARSYFCLGEAALDAGDTTAARAAFMQSLQIHRTAPDTPERAAPIPNVASAGIARGDSARARALYEVGLHSRHEWGSRRAIAAVQHGLARVALAERDVPRARVYFARKLALLRQTGCPPSTVRWKEALEGISAGSEP